MAFDAENEDAEHQRDEILALESIYGDINPGESFEVTAAVEEDNEASSQTRLMDEFYEWRKQPVFTHDRQESTADGSKLRFGRILVDVQLEEPAAIRYQQSSSSQPSKSCEKSVAFLPAVVMDFILPSDYPSRSGPIVTLSSVWMDSTLNSLLLSDLERTWTENQGMPILFQFISVIQQSLTEHFSKNTLDLMELQESKSSSQVPLPSCDTVVSKILDYCRFRELQQFEQSSYECLVCFCERPGSYCLKFQPCEHVFCVECVSGYFQSQIKQGLVRHLVCLAGKCNSSATERQVKRCISSTLFEQYERLLLHQTLDLMTDVVPCPRPACQAPVLLDPQQTKREDEKDKSSERILPPMATCALCHLTFCGHCRKGYHGLASCTFTKSDQQKLLNDYHTGDDATKKSLEKRFGKKKLDEILNEFLSRRWISENSKNCPKCGVSIELNFQKKDGCNKMLCTKCDSKFCWICEKVISDADPYVHFNNPGSSCIGKLFEGVESSDEEDGDDDFI